MIKRSITSLFISAIFAGVIIGALKVHYIFFDSLVMILMIIGAIEVCNAIKQKYDKPFVPIVIVSCIVGYCAFFIVNHWMSNDPLISVTAFLMVIAGAVLISMLRYSFSKVKNIGNAVSTVFALFYPCAIMVFMIALNYLDNPYRAIGLIMLFTVAPFSDVFAYLIGSTLKGKKLCPTISPKKTISGAIGGLFGGLLGGVLMILITKSEIAIWFGIDGMLGTTDVINVVNCLILGLLGSVCTQLGDILASYIKRRCKIKDYGNILPGHGGVMDRFDGMIIYSAFLFVYMSVLSIIW